MKIAIKGHKSRGKEVIQILESLGTKNISDHTGLNEDWYYMRDDSLCPEKLIITSADETFLKQYGYQVYTLEEFEKDFPFKIGDEVMFPVKTGWASGKITGLTYVGDQLKYEVDNRIAGYRYIEPRILQLYPMKEERNITLTLDKAKEWYNKGGELKEIALQAFNEKELNPLPKTWEEFCEKYPIREGECFLGFEDKINVTILHDYRRRYKNWIPSKKSAEAHLAMIQLEQLRDCWRQGVVPQGAVYKIKKIRNKYTVVYGADDVFLSFCNLQTAKEFLECFRDLIEKVGDLI